MDCALGVRSEAQELAANLSEILESFRIMTAGAITDEKLHTVRAQFGRHRGRPRHAGDPPYGSEDGFFFQQQAPW